MPGSSYVDRLPGRRPPGLRLRAVTATWHRLDSISPDEWTWQPFPTPRYRFDSASGALRVRYAANSARCAMRERFDDVGRVVTVRDLDRPLVELSGRINVLDLRRDDILDTLGLDDQISTSRAPEVWVACQQLIDLVMTWFGNRCHGVVYRSRTTPQRSANLAFGEHAPLTPRSLGPLRDQVQLVDSCIVSDGFLVQGWR